MSTVTYFDANTSTRYGSNNRNDIISTANNQVPVGMKCDASFPVLLGWTGMEDDENVGGVETCEIDIVVGVNPVDDDVGEMSTVDSVVPLIVTERSRLIDKPPDSEIPDPDVRILLSCGCPTTGRLKERIRANCVVTLPVVMVILP